MNQSVKRVDLARAPIQIDLARSLLRIDLANHVTRFDVHPATAVADATGTIDLVLDPIEFSALGSVSISGVLNVDLDAIEFSANGVSGASGIIAVELDAVTFEASGTVAISGSLDAALDTVSFSAASGLAISGTLDSAVDAVVLDASGDIGLSGTLDAALGAVTLSASGTLGISGVLDAAIGAVQMSATGTLAIDGTMSAALGAATFAASGAVAIAGVLDAALGAITISATGTLSSLVLDSISSAPAGAYSLNDRLKTAYTGALIRVRRSSDNTEQDIGYGADNMLDRTALSTFCGAGNGFLVTLYDQSGNGRNLTQSTAANQPSVYNAGSVRTSGGNVIAVFDGTNDSLSRADALGMSGDANLTIAMLYRLDALPGQRATFGVGGTGFSNEFVLGHDSAAANTLIATSDESLDTWPVTNATSYHYDVVRHTSGQNMSLVSWRQNGAALTPSATVTSTVSLTNTSTRLGCHLANLAFAQMSWSTLLVWNAVISGDDLTALETWLESKRTA